MATPKIWGLFKNSFETIMKIIDISVSIDKNIPVWPTASKPQYQQNLSLKKGHSANDSTLHMNLHTGTHIDAPSHFIKNGKTVDSLDPKIFIGPVFVAHFPKAKEIGVEELKKLKTPKNTERILFKTSNSALWGGTSKFNKNYVGITTGGAKWLTKNNFKLIGVDYLSIAKYDDAVKVHCILLGKGVVLLEGIDLSKVKSGVYNLMCLPIKLANLEAAPVRAILTK